MKSWSNTSNFSGYVPLFAAVEDEEKKFLMGFPTETRKDSVTAE
jgi:hypothetical protein